jgi:hypothetical protein
VLGEVESVLVNDDRRILNGGTDDYVARGFSLIDGDKVDLHRFAARLRR